MSKNLKQQKGDGGDMEYKNNEGYPDPTAGKRSGQQTECQRIFTMFTVH